MKKFTKKFIIMLLTLVLLIVNTNFAFAIEIVSPDVEIKSPVLYDAATSTLDLSTYFDFEEFNDYMVEQLKTVDGTSSTLATINISKFNIPESNAIEKALQEHIWYNSPELFRIGSMGIGSSGNKYTYIQFYSYYTKEEYAEMHEKMVTEAEELLKGVKDNPNLTDVEKALLLHDRLALHCEYDYDTLSYDYENMPRSSYNAYGVLVLRDAVCMGYALAYDYLLEQVGIKTLYCSSDTLNHAWNIVYINNTPYHVDVTWDDPVWDMCGRVSHENFLRSTQGIKSTGHTATDFFSFPADTTYDNYYWQNSNTAFQLIEDEIYFFNTTEKSLYKLSNENSEDTEFLLKIPYNWAVSATSFYSTSFVMLVSDGENLYYNIPNAIYKYDVENACAKEFYKPDLSTFESYNFIYGLEYQNCKFTYVINDKYEYGSNKDASGIPQKPTDFQFTIEHHIPSDWITVKEPTLEEDGEKQQKCLNCSCILNTETIPKALICAAENTDTIIEENIIFTSTDLCKNIETLLNFSDSVTYEISASHKTSSTELLGTGSIISIFKKDEKVGEYKVIIAGDLNGDSVCDVLDVMITELCYTNNKIPSADECYAANGTKKDAIDEVSFQYVVNTAMKVDL